MKIMFRQKGQSFLENAVLIVIVVAALLTMRVYIKRGIQGSWHRGIDDLGQQYDPNSTNEDYNYTLTSNVVSNLVLSANLEECQRTGCYINRVDSANTYETTNASTNIAGY